MSDIKYLYIAEKPSVARAFANSIGEKFKKSEGYLESETSVVTWCLGHLVSMSYPEKYDEKYKSWRMENLPFIPQQFIYEVISNVKKQFNIVNKLLSRDDITRIYVCTDSGREGEYIYRLVRQLSNVENKEELRVWINSQTDDEIRRGINEAKPLCEYNSLSDCAYLRAKEDYLIGINFSRALSIRYGGNLAKLLNRKYMPISVGRVMTCVLGMVVEREREIRDFVKKPFYRVFANLTSDITLPFEYKSDDEIKSPGFSSEEKARTFISEEKASQNPFTVKSVVNKKEKKYPPLLYNLAELQNEASKVFKISPEETLNIAQKLYESGLTTYPRTDAKVLSKAVAKEIGKILNGLNKIPQYSRYVNEIHEKEYYKGLIKSRYVNDEKITDHYAIIPTGQLKGKNKLSTFELGLYDLIVKRFLAIFFPESVSRKLSIEVSHGSRKYIHSAKALVSKGYREIYDTDEFKGDEIFNYNIKKGDVLKLHSFEIKRGETTPPKRYTSGSMVLAMENAGKLIEDESLREQIVGTGIGTSATRAGIIEKLCKNKYLVINKKTQILTPSMTGELIYDVVYASIRPMLNPTLTASWEKGLFLVENNKVTVEEYMEKLTGFVVKYTEYVKNKGLGMEINESFNKIKSYYS